MYLQVISIEHSLESPKAELGDATLSPNFRRVSARCPVLHLFGYSHIPLENAGMMPRRTTLEFLQRGSSSDEASVSRAHGSALCDSSAVDQYPLGAAGPSSGGAVRDGKLPPLAVPLCAFGNPSNDIAVDRLGRPPPPSRPDSTTGASSPPTIPAEGKGNIAPPVSADRGRSSTLMCARYVQRRTCLHVHGVYPSFLLPQYDRSVSADQLAAQLEAVALRFLASQGTAVSYQQLVHSVRVVHRYSVYGYRPHAYSFYLVELIDPNLVTKVIELLQNTEMVGGRRWQLYDAHKAFPTQFMVQCRLNGATPYPIPIQRCHVRLPTVAELRPPVPRSVSSCSSSIPQPLERDERHHATPPSCGGTEPENAREGEDGGRRDTHARSSFLSFRRYWQPDELGRGTTAEVELDVTGEDLLDGGSAPLTDLRAGASAATTTAAASPRKGAVPTAAGDNLSYTRHVIKAYFREHGVPDALRVADTIATERCEEERAYQVAVLPPLRRPLKEVGSEHRMPQQEDGENAVPRRYGTVSSIQHGDPAVRWMYHRMRAYLMERAGTAAPTVGCTVVTPVAVKETHKREASTFTTPRMNMGIPASSPTLQSAVASLQQEQRMIRQQLVAPYMLTGGGGVSNAHRRWRDGEGATRSHDGRLITAPPSSAATDGGREDAMYVGYSSESVQLSLSQFNTPQQEDAQQRAPLGAKAFPTVASAEPRSPGSPPSGLSVYADVVAAPTQDLWDALAGGAALPLPSQDDSLHPTPFESVALSILRRHTGHDNGPAPSAPSTGLRAEPPRVGFDTAEATVSQERFAAAVPPVPSSRSSSPAEVGVVDAKTRAEDSWSSWSTVSSCSSSSMASHSMCSRGSAKARSKRSDRLILKVERGTPAEAALAIYEEDTRLKHTGEGVDISTVSESPAPRLAAQALQSPNRRSGQTARMTGTLPLLLAPPQCTWGHSPSRSRARGGPCATEDSSSPENGGRTSGGADGSPRSFEDAVDKAEDGESLVVPPSPSLLIAPSEGQFRRGDFLAFVLMRQTAPSMLRIVGEVLAVARVDEVQADSVTLQWLMALSETHLAADQAALVRRGMWLRPHRFASAAAAVSSSASPLGYTQRGEEGLDPAAEPVVVIGLGEMLLSNVRDAVAASVLRENTPATIASTSGHPAPTPRLLETATMVHTVGSSNEEEHMMARRNSERLPPAHGLPACPHARRMAAAVQVWPVRCFTDIMEYSGAAVSPPCGLRDAGDTLPQLRVLCRYAYDVEARVLTALSAEIPSLRSCGTPHRLPRPATRCDTVSADYKKRGDGAVAVASTMRANSLGETVMTATERYQPRRASSSRMVFTQPEPLLSLSHLPPRAQRASPSLCPVSHSSSISPPALFSSSCSSVEEPVKRRRGEGSLGADTAEEEEEEERPLFLDSTVNSHRSDSTGEEAPPHGRSDYFAENRLGTPPPRPRQGGSSAPMEGTPQRSATARSIAHSSSLQLSPVSRVDAVSPSLVLVRRRERPSQQHFTTQRRDSKHKQTRWHLVMMRGTPPQEFVVGAQCVHRGVQAACRSAAERSTALEQGRWRPPHWTGCALDNHTAGTTTAMTAEGKGSGTAGTVAFSNASPGRTTGGDSQSTQVTWNRNRKRLRLQDEVDLDELTSGSAEGEVEEEGEGREAVAVVVASPSPDSVSSLSERSLMRSGSAVRASSAPVSSFDAVHEMTASQRTLLRWIQRSVCQGCADGLPRTVLQGGGQLCGVTDGLPRPFLLTAVAPTTPYAISWGDGGAGRVNVSAVSWPWATWERTAVGCGALSRPHREPIFLFPAVAEEAAQRLGSTERKSAPLPCPAGLSSKSHPACLARSESLQPQHYLQCVLRVLYVEVLLNRRLGEKYVSASEVLAVGLGQATSAADSPVSVRLFCVARPAFHTGPAPNAHAVPRPPALHGLTQSVEVETLQDEAALLIRVREEILRYDPDVLLSWDGFKYGLGSLMLRYRAVLQRNLAADLSRMVEHHLKGRRPPASEKDDTVSLLPTKAAESEQEPLAHPRKGVPSRSPVATETSLLRTETDTAVLRAAAKCGRASSLSEEESTDDAAEAPCATRRGAEASSSSLGSSTSSFSCLPVGGTAVSKVGSKAGGEEQNRVDTALAPMAGLREASDGCYRLPNDSANRASPREHSCAGSEGSAEVAIAAATTSSAAAADRYSRRFGASCRIVGRICTSLGKDLRKEIKLSSYSLSMVHAALLGEPLAYFTDSFLAELLVKSSGDDATVQEGGGQYTALRYLASRVAASHRIACKLHWFTKLLEFSRMYGILMEEVVTRGSQFRVEATLLRLAQPLGYAMLSPSLVQVHRQPRIECIPLVMQPKSDFYRDDPVVVLDFRSLYPSIIVAYNLCYSTCLGMVQPHQHGRLGVLSHFKQSESVLRDVLLSQPDDACSHDGVVFAPNGAMFVGASTRVGLLPQMVQSVLDARFEVQSARKHIAVPLEDVVMQQRLQEQQLALKMLANVTYGYTAASFTGRMPCVDLAEAIVSLGRQTLERAIALIHGTAAWQAEVVYGDTDSLFIRLARRSKAEAFRIGEEMADAVTQSNPAPIRMQFEKVLLPCILLVKKRYAGYMWTSSTQTTPTFLAKGIEVVRRDQCLMTAQLTQRLLRLLFDGAAAQALRLEFQDAVQRMRSGAVNPLLLIFRRAVKLDRYGDAADPHLPLAARLALQDMEKDVLQTPYWGERLPYVVVVEPSAGGGRKVAERVLHPERLLSSQNCYHLDTNYYVTRHLISTLDRIFYLIGVSFAQWYQSMPRRRTLSAMLWSIPASPMAQQHGLPVQSLLEDAGISLHPLSNDAATELSPQRRLAHSTLVGSLMRDWVRRADTHLGVPLPPMNSASTAREVCEVEDEYGEAQPPPEVQDLTRPTLRDVVDVEQGSTQRSSRSSFTTGAKPRPRGHRPVMDWVRIPSPGRRRPTTTTTTTTLDSFCSRTLCVICEVELVGASELQQQLSIFRQAAAAVGVHSRRGTPPAPSRPRLPEQPESPTSLNPFLPLPPICARCWGDPATLYLHVQQRCRALGRQQSFLRSLCGRCVGNGDDAAGVAGSLYGRAVADMEDMCSFQSSAVMREEEERRCAPEQYAGNLMGVGSFPSEVLSAVRLSPTGLTCGCVSVDCAVSFQKKWSEAQWTQWQALLAFLSTLL